MSASNNNGGGQQQQQQQPAPEASIFKQSSHPVALLFHMLFRTAAVAYYAIVLTLFNTEFTQGFIITILLLVFDFWTVKNVTGRLLVGLRWWNRIKEDRTNEWIYESKPPNIIVNPVDSRVFWFTLYLFPVIWLAFSLFCLFTLKLSWFVLTAVALILNMANLNGYSQCDKEAKKRAMGNIGTGLVANMLSNRFFG